MTCMTHEPAIRKATLLAVALVLSACGGDQPGALGTEGAHEHGVARLNVAVEGTSAVVEFVSPAMGIYGFEYEPTSDEDRRRQAEGLETLRVRFAEMVVFDPGLGCSVEPVHVGVEGEDHDHDEGTGHSHEHGEGYVPDPSHHPEGEGGSHSHGHSHDEDHDHQEGDEGQDHGHDHDHDGHDEVRAEFEVTCQRPLSGSRVTLNMGAVFGGIEQVDVQVVGDRPSGGRYRASGTSVQL